MLGRVDSRVLRLVALVCAALAVCVPSALGQKVRHAGNSCARPFDTSTHWEAVFGHTSSMWQAVLLRRQLQTRIKGIQFEQDWCDDIELEIPGFDSPDQRKTFAKEADISHVPVSFEPPDQQKTNKPGEVTAVFGRFPTLARASALQGEIAVKGWRENELVRLSIHSWKVIVMHIPASAKSGFTTEAKGAGYTITYEP